MGNRRPRAIPMRGGAPPTLEKTPLRSVESHESSPPLPEDTQALLLLKQATFEAVRGLLDEEMARESEVEVAKSSNGTRSATRGTCPSRGSTVVLTRFDSISRTNRSGGAATRWDEASTECETHRREAYHGPPRPQRSTTSNIVCSAGAR